MRTPTTLLSPLVAGFSATTLMAASLLGGPATAWADDAAISTEPLVHHPGGWQIANAELHPSGRTVDTLFPHGGRIFVGHGDYDANSGSLPVADGTDIGSYDPTTGQHSLEMAGFTTEEVKVFREIDGALYAPNVDPTTVNADQPYVTNAAGQWGYGGESIPDVLHIYDMAKLGDEWFLFGSARTATHGQAGTVQAAATIWKSANGLTDWTVSHQAPETLADYDGFERFYWGATHDDTLYAVADEGIRGEKQPLMQYRDGIWSQAPVATPAASWLPRLDAQRVLSTEHGIAFAIDQEVTLFDGDSFTSLPLAPGGYLTNAAPGDDGHVYVLDSNLLVSRVDLAAGTVTPVWQGGEFDLFFVTAMTFVDGTLHFAGRVPGSSANTMFTATLPAAPVTTPEDPPVTTPGPPQGPKPGKGHGHGHGKTKPAKPNKGKADPKSKPSKPSKAGPTRPGKTKK